MNRRRSFVLFSLALLAVVLLSSFAFARVRRDGVWPTQEKTVTLKLTATPRADAVRDYLYKQHGVPLFRINTISFGAENPAGDNKTKEGRAQNRRVVIKVLS